MVVLVGQIGSQLVLLFFGGVSRRNEGGRVRGSGGDYRAGTAYEAPGQKGTDARHKRLLQGLLQRDPRTWDTVEVGRTSVSARDPQFLQLLCYACERLSHPCVFFQSK
jgi:hypothetical protein